MQTTALAPETPALVLEPNDRAPARARRHLAERFAEIGHADDFTGRLIVTELVTNSYRHVGFGHIIVRIFPDTRKALTVIEVWDQSTTPPTVRPHDGTTTGGRGLPLVAELAHDWGVRPLNNQEGKITWARCAR